MQIWHCLIRPCESGSKISAPLSFANELGETKRGASAPPAQVLEGALGGAKKRQQVCQILKLTRSTLYKGPAI